MIKSTISGTRRQAFAKANGKKIAGGFCESKPTVQSLVLNHYTILATGNCSDRKLNQELNNVIMFKKQKEVA